MAKFEALDTQIIAINPASLKAHGNYQDKFGFDFPILSDPDRKTAAQYKALKENGKSIQRTVYVVDKAGMIRFAEQGMPPDEKMLEAIRGF